MSGKARRRVLVGALAVAFALCFTGLAQAVTIAPPWCGTPEPDAAGALPDGSNPSDNSSGAARLAVFAMNPLYRADPEREWPAFASAAYWVDQSRAAAGIRSAEARARGQAIVDRRAPKTRPR